MDQLKEILRQAIKYRFWIAVGISALLPIVAYIVGSGPVQAKTATETAKIEGAKKKVEVYANGVVPNRQWPPLVAENTEVLSKDVRAAWKKLYARQAPLLTWPEIVQERFLGWGRKWPPETEDSSRVVVAIAEYVPEYQNYVESVYQSFHPFDTETGKGIVAAPPRDALLRPAQFAENEPPDLGKVWAAQERLWLQRTMLEVIADVNKNAKDWNTAIVRQINSLEVGSPAAQDQKSLAKGDTLEEAPAITDPKAPPPPEPEQTQSTMPGMPGMGLGKEKPDAVFYLKKAEGTQSEQYKTLPVQMSVLVDQDHIPDFLVALENSPMSVQVMDFDMGKPTARVVRPEKGVDMAFGGYGTMGMMGMMGSSRMMGPPLSGYGGSNAMQQMMARMQEMGKMRGGPMMGGGPASGGTSKRSGVDKRSFDARKKREQEKEKDTAQKPKMKSIHDPYYNIVEVTVYCQARFYNPPPPEPVAEPSQAPSETAAVPVEGAEKGETEKAKGESEKAEGADEKAKGADEKAKGEDEKAKGEDEKAMPEAEKTKDEAEKTKGEAVKAEDEKAKSDDAPKEKADTPKDEPEKASPKR